MKKEKSQSKEFPINIPEIWISRAEEMLENIKNFKPNKDRVRTTTEIIYIHNALHEAIVNWSRYLNGWLSTELNKTIGLKEEYIILSNKELLEAYEIMKKFSISFLKYVLVMTKLLETRQSNKFAKEFLEKTGEEKMPHGMVV